MARIIPFALLLAFLAGSVPASAQFPPIPTDSVKKYEGTRKMIELLKATVARFNVPGNSLANNARVKIISELVKTSPENENSLYQEMLLAGKTEPAIAGIEKLLAKPNLHRDVRTRLRRLQAIAYMRLGEQENCVMNHTSQSCLAPIEGNGVHRNQRGSRKAIELYSEFLRDFPDDIPSRWLLNVAYMTVGEYPDKVPPQWVYPKEIFNSDYAINRFTDIAPDLGLADEGLSGGGCTEDFDNDGDIDIMRTSWGVADQMHYYRNNGDGTFTDATADAHLEGIIGGLNMFTADYNNDGFIDVFITRGAWMGQYGSHPKSLLRNNGDGTFTDVAIEAGVVSMHPTEAAAWGDFDNDGLLDLFIGNETTVYEVHPCELYHNNGDGTFTNIAHEAGVDVLGIVKAAVWGDYDNDGLIDLYVSSLSQVNRLFKNNGKKDGKWTFTDVAAKAGVQGPMFSFPTFFFDYDNDGWLDLFVSDFGGSATGTFNGLPVVMEVIGPVVNDYLGKPHEVTIPSLYHNNHDGTFTDVATKMHLDKTLFGMGCNFGDLDNDGYLDIYVGTGHPDLQVLIPNRMFRNAEGKSFQDVTTSGGFGHLQKGHAICFADIDNDGDQDIYEVMGGAFEGDVARMVLFQNPGTSNHWVTLVLEGVKANRAAIGARIGVTVADASGKKREMHVMVGSGGSFGCSSMQQEIGLGNATRIESVEITWPGSNTRQTLRNVPMDRVLKIREGSDAIVTLNRPAIKMPGAGTEPHHHHDHGQDMKEPAGHEHDMHEHEGHDGHH